MCDVGGIGPTCGIEHGKVERLPTLMPFTTSNFKLGTAKCSIEAPHYDSEAGCVAIGVRSPAAGPLIGTTVVYAGMKQDPGVVLKGWCPLPRIQVLCLQ